MYQIIFMKTGLLTTRIMKRILNMINLVKQSNTGHGESMPVQTVDGTSFTFSDQYRDHMVRCHSV
jgi:hypothetical protein